LLRSLIGPRIVTITRYLIDSPPDTARGLRGGDAAVFSHGIGPLVVTTKAALAIGFATEPELASVTVWLESGAFEGAVGDARLRSRSELYPIDITDERHADPAFRNLPGQRIQAIHVLVMDVAYRHYLPREVAVVLRFEDGTELVPADWRIHTDADQLSVIRRDEIVPRAWPVLHELALEQLSPAAADPEPQVPPFASGPPSRCREFLSALVGQRITAIQRYTREVDSSLPPIGDLVMTTETGLQVGFTVFAAERSVEVWIERGELGRWRASPLDLHADSELHLHDAAEPGTASPIGRRLEGIRVLERDPAPEGPASLGQVGIILQLEGGIELIVGCGLGDDSNQLQLLHREGLLPSLLPQLHERTLDELAPWSGP
jgi:hypothetical protein